MKSLIKKTVVSSLLALGAITNSFADDCLSGNCYALVINNYDYGKFGKLINTEKDGRDVREQLKMAGFSVKQTAGISTKQDFDAELEAFTTAAKNEAKKENSFALVYYSGHGALENREIFLLPTDLNNLRTKLNDSKGEQEQRLTAFKENALSVNELIAKLKDLLESKKFQGVLLIVDACQNEVKLENTIVAGNSTGNKELVLNEIKGASSDETVSNPGITLNDIPDGLLAMFAAKPSTVSKDTLKNVKLENSLYTSQFLNLLRKEESMTFLELIAKVERNVMDISKSAGEIQKPYLVGSTSAFSNFYFIPPEEFEPYNPMKF